MVHWNAIGLASGTGGAGLNTVAVSAGDKVYLIVHPKANISCDTTVVNLTISVTGAPTSTPTPTLTNTPTATVTPTATATFTPLQTPTNTATPLPTNTPTSTATSTATVPPTPTPQDRWYTGNRRSSSYGVRAFISAPAQAPTLTGSGESSWVSTTPPSETQNYWIQTGWRYYQGDSYAKTYVEVKPPSGYITPYEYDMHFWGMNVEYEVSWLSGNIWCASISGELKNCHNIGVSAPRQVQAMSEIHVYPQNELDVNFSNVYYMDVNGEWFLFDQANWKEDAPYMVDKTNNYEYHNYLP